MEQYHLSQDMNLILYPAKNFPNDVESAFKELDKKIGGGPDRVWFGISKGSPNGIVYWAAGQEAYEGEGKKAGLDTLLLTKGKYMTETIEDWRNNKEKFMEVFGRLLKYPEMDTDFPCVEWYKGEKEVMCMIKIKQKK
jgi:hypothetical protein